MISARHAPAKRTLAIDIGWSSLKALRDERGIEVPLERGDDGRLTTATKERIARELGALRERGRGVPRVPCGVPARGLSLRSFTVPAAPRDEVESLLALQVERDLPLPPEMVAWGYEAHGNGALPVGMAANAGRSAPVPVTVALLRRELLDDYETVLRDAGLAPAFVPGVLAGAWTCPREPGRSLFLDVGKTRTEALLSEDGKPAEVKTLSWGGDVVTVEVARALGVGFAEAEEAKRRWGRSLEGSFVISPAGTDDAIFAASRRAVDGLARALEEWWAADLTGEAAVKPARIYLAGGGAELPGLPEALGERLGGALPCRALPHVAGAGRSAVTLALTRAAGAGGDLPLAFLPPARRKKEAPLARGRGALAFWLAAAAVLLLAAAALRYLPPILRLPRLAERVEEARTRRAAMPELDRELGFLDRLEKSQPPYLEALLAMARAIPKGTAFESLSLNRQGDVSIQGRAANFDGLNELRGKLAASGWFTKVIIIEHTPKEREQVDFRISATLRVGSPLPALPAAGGAPAGPGTPAGPPAPEAMAAPVPAGPVPPAGEPPPKQDASPPPGTAPGAASAPPEPPKGAAPAADAAEREHLKKQVAESARALGGARGGEVKVEFADGVDAESRAALEKTAADATAAEEQNK